MRQILIRYLMVLLLCVLGLLALDWWNFPLSPINVLSRLQPVDLTLRLPGVSDEELEALLASEGGAELSILDAQGKPVLTQATDGKGRLRHYLPPGSYLVLGSLSALQGEDQVVIHETRGPLGLEVRNRKVLGIVELVPNAQTDAVRLLAYLEKQLSRGEFDRTLAILRKLDSKEVPGYQQVAERVQFIGQKLREGMVQLRALQQLGPDSYNSSILVLRRLEEIVSSLTQRGGDMTLRFAGERFNPVRRGRSTVEARDAILASRLGVAQQALRARAFREALVEYRAALSDPELWRPEQPVSPEIQSQIDAFQQAHQGLTDQVQTELLEQLAQGMDAYRQGDLEKAQGLLIRVSRALARLKGELEMPEAEQSSATYLQDIEAIVRAQSLQKEQRWAEALDAYTAVANVNPVVRQGILEAQSKRGQGPPPAPGAAPAPAVPTDL